MSRHRFVRDMDYDDFYDDWEEWEEDLVFQEDDVGNTPVREPHTTLGDFIAPPPKADSSAGALHRLQGRLRDAINELGLKANATQIERAAFQCGGDFDASLVALLDDLRREPRRVVAPVPIVPIAKKKAPAKESSKTKPSSPHNGNFVALPKEEEKKEPAERASTSGITLTKEQRKIEKAKQDMVEAELERRAKVGEKERMNLVVCGHVDAGKSTMMGHLLFLQGRVSKRDMHKHDKMSKEYGKASFKFAWVLDAHEEERTRGVTVDVGIEHFETEHRDVTLLDAPGHRDFVPNMISGASQADCAILVLDASIGEFESGFKDEGQTKEHAVLLRSVGVSSLIVAVNKLDVVDWSHERYIEIQEAILPFLLATGFKQKNITVVPCSGLTGENIVERTSDDLSTWYSGPTLLACIDTLKTPKRALDKPFRFSIADVFKSHRQGITVGGKIESGVLVKDESAVLVPGNVVVQVKSILHHEEFTDMAMAGDNVDIGLHNVDDLNRIHIGQIMCCLREPLQMTNHFEINVVTVATLEVPLVKGSDVVLHVNSVDVPAHLSKLIALLKKSDGTIKRKRPRCIVAKQSVTVRIKAAFPICLDLYSNMKQYGRVTLRREGQTVGVGIVTKMLKNYEYT